MPTQPGPGSPALHTQRAWASPAATALAIQGIVLALVLALVSAGELFGFFIPLAAAAALQGALAAWLSRGRLAPWWPPIQFFFPLAVVGVQAVGLPPGLFLAAFLILLSLFWTTFRTQVPFYPSAAPLRSSLAALLPSERAVRFVDIGSGLGGLVLDLARRRPDSEFTGIEIAPLPWLASLARKRLTGSAARFLRGDYNNLDLSCYDVVFAYLSPAAMPALWEKATSEMRAGTMLLSYEFDIPSKEPDIVREPDEYGRRLYGWKM